jgi:hypothetical protein
MKDSTIEAIQIGGDAIADRGNDGGQDDAEVHDGRPEVNGL